MDHNIQAVMLRFRAATYNLRMGHLDHDPVNCWQSRKTRTLRSLASLDADIVCLQEVNLQMQEDLRAEFGGRYSMHFFSPYSSDGQGDKAHGIMVRSSDFLISDFHFFWMGDDFSVPSVSDRGVKGEFMRGGCCAVLCHKLSGERLFVMCTHACYNPEPNARYAWIYECMERRYNAEKLPSLLLGDMNAEPSSPSSIRLRSYWKDSRMVLPPEAVSGVECTYNAFMHLEGNMRIDYVYFRGDHLQALRYHCDSSLYDGFFASDHFPVWVDFMKPNMKI